MSTIKSSAENLTLNADGANNDVIIQSNGSTKVTVDGATGNVGIGNSAPTAPLTLGDTSDAQTVLQMFSATTGASTIHFGDGASAAAYSGYINYNHADNSMQFASSGSEKMRIDSSGNVGIGNTSPAVPLDVTGNIRTSTGILFGTDTAAANALDDYEEGTWTPVITGSNGNPTVTYHSQTSGQYTKVGNIVAFDGIIQWTAYSGGTSTSAILLSLPFSSSGASPWASTISVTYHSLTEDGYGGYSSVGNATSYIVNTTNNAEIKTDKAGATGLIMYHGTMKVA